MFRFAKCVCVACFLLTWTQASEWLLARVMCRPSEFVLTDFAECQISNELSALIRNESYFGAISK